jgi:recombination protein RecA
MTPKEELEGSYEKNTIGLGARVVSKGLRKITGVISNNNVTLAVVSQQRMKIGCSSPETMIEYRQIE